AFLPEQINHDYHWLLAMGRLKRGVTRQQAQADMDAVTAHIAAAYPVSNKGWGASVEKLQNDFLPPERIRNLWLLLGAVGFVLEGILPSEANFQLDIHVLVVALAATTFAGLLFGCAPAWYASRVDPGESLKEGGRTGTRTGSHKLRRGLITGEFALALSLLAG